MFLENDSRNKWERFERNLRFFEQHPRLYRIKAGVVVVWSVLLMTILIAVAAILLTAFIVYCLVKNQSRLIQYVKSFETPKPAWESDLFLPPDLFPALYDKTNILSDLIKRPRIDRIYIGTSFNASVTSINARIPGMRRNILIIGYPLLCTASIKSINALIVHELEHVSRPFFSLESRLFSLRNAWRKQLVGLLRFFNRIIVHHIRLLTHTLHPLSREHEKLTDKAVCEKLGRKVFLESIALTALNARLFEDDKTFKLTLAGCKKTRELDFDAAVRNIFSRGRDPEYARTVLEEALKATTLIYDEHPSFRERVGDKDIPKLLPYAAATLDAESALTGRNRDIMRSMLNTHYRKRWANSLPGIQADYLHQVKTLGGTDPENPQDECKMLDYIDAARELGHEDLAVAGIMKATTHYPESLTFRAMRLVDLLVNSESDDERARLIDDLKGLLRLRPWLIHQLNDDLLRYYLRHDMTDRIKELLELREHCLKPALREAKKTLPPEDDLSEIELPEHRRAELLQIFAQNAASIAAVYPVKRRYSADTLVFVKLMVIHKASWLSIFLGNGKSDRKLVAQCGKLIPSYTFRVGTSKQIAMLRELGIRPLVVPLGKRQYR